MLKHFCNKACIFVNIKVSVSLCLCVHLYVYVFNNLNFILNETSSNGKMNLSMVISILAVSGNIVDLSLATFHY